jgi:hypothetical protein
MISELLLESHEKKIEIDNVLANMVNVNGSQYAMLPCNGYYIFNVVVGKRYKIIASNNDVSKEASFSVYDASISMVLRTVVVKPGKTVSIPVEGNTIGIVCTNSSKKKMMGACLFVSLYSAL